MATVMTWEQKFEALGALAECVLTMRVLGKWVASQPNVNLADVHFIRTENGHGNSPEAAVEDRWRQLVTGVPAGQVVCVSKAGARRYVRWNGFMWGDVEKPS